jgi:hypothetical protein
LLVAGGMANAQMFAVTGTAPAHAATDVPVLNDVSMMCSESLQTPTVTANTFFLYSSKQAAVPATITFPVANQATLNPTGVLIPGIRYRCFALGGILATNLDTLNAMQWSFFTEALGSGLLFSNRTYALENDYSHDVALGDLTGNGTLDAFVVNGPPGDYANQIWTNNGGAYFVKHGSAMGTNQSLKVELADFTGDGALDAFIVNEESLQVWTNDGSGNFGLQFENAVFRGRDAALGDIDNDGWMDAVVVDYLDSNTVWRNNGSGTLVLHGTFDSYRASAVALGDINNDGYLDIITGNEWLLGSTQGNKAMLNDGNGNFTTTASEFGTNDTIDVALGDFNGDGYIDVYAANDSAPNAVWTNDGSGVFGGPVGHPMGAQDSRAVILGDLNGDGHLDAFVANKGNHEPNQVWTNDGSGIFGARGPGLGTANSFGADLGDLNGDGMLDAFVANNGELNQIWFNQTMPLTQARNDFDGDGKSDLAVFWSLNGQWYVKYSGGGSLIGFQWGWNQTMPVSDDFDNDGIADFSAFYPQDGDWYIRYSSGGTLFDEHWGPAQATPVPADYDGDGLADIGYYANGLWYIRYSSGGLSLGIEWGWPGVFPVQADYDGDGVADIGVFYRDTGDWYIRRSSDGSLWQKNWGWGDVYPAPADYDDDGTDDFCVYWPQTGQWFIEYSGGGVHIESWGWNAAVPVPGDYDGDGHSDLAVYDLNTGNWYVSFSSGGGIMGENWGWPDAVPVSQVMLHWSSGN